MAQLRRNSFVPFFQRDLRPDPAALLSVTTLVHAAGHLLGREVASDILVLEKGDAVAPFVDAINELASDTIDSNPQFEGDALQAAMTYLGGDDEARIALVWGRAAHDGKRILLGVFPYRESRFLFGLPVRVWSIWTHIHSYIATPLIRKGHEKQAVAMFLSFADKAGAGLVRMPLFEGVGGFDAALTQVMAEEGRVARETERHERAFLQSDAETGEAYLAAHMRKKKRKEFNRLWNRLSEQGDLQFLTHEGGEDIDHTIDRFLRLEAKGWKGKRGTALRVRPSEKRYFETICKAAYREGKLHVTELTLDGEAIAMLASFRAGEGLYTFKIGFDEAWGKYSPGALLMMKVIDPFLRDPRTAWVDSCAIPNHPMIDHIWAERRLMRSLIVGTSHRASPLFVFYAGIMTRLVDKARDVARHYYHRMRKEIEHE
ncbi:MAG: GNAT family N-acetyltransferase [Rhizobiales bacterium]|nr:GNAT family N-acetyltransferase [Hyphomicrobiales bacterium]